MKITQRIQINITKNVKSEQKQIKSKAITETRVWEVRFVLSDVILTPMSDKYL